METKTSKFTEAEALAQNGDLYRHKKGGIYRLLQITTVPNYGITWKGDKAYSPGELLAVYEHLWPHENGEFRRPYSEFSQPERFAKIIRINDSEG